MVGLTREQHNRLADKLPDTANVALGALVFGQFLGGAQPSLVLIAYGIGLWLLLMGASLVFDRMGRL
ncbi:MAG: hypothetical protein HY657_17320 [Acidobacteria bacterium]|nr:hypothetical protein [Acidobacteriota bacterium]